MFQRGQTQILTAATLAPMSSAQKVDGLDESETSKRYMHHYNFPSWSVGETKPSRGPGRREIGHGALAERALIPVLPTVEEFPYAIRTVSETLESNGSTSQASVCASTLALMAAGVPIKRMVAGISVGLVTGDSDDDYIVLTDIQGLEDFFGDMDFKVAGTHKGITAIQMDIKIHGLTDQIIREAIARTKEADVYKRQHLRRVGFDARQLTDVNTAGCGDPFLRHGIWSAYSAVSSHVGDFWFLFLGNGSASIRHILHDSLVEFLISLYLFPGISSQGVADQLHGLE